MNKQCLRRALLDAILFSILGSMFTVTPAMADGLTGQSGHRSDGGYYTLVDEKGKEITKSAWALTVGDAYIDADNRKYELVRIEKNTIHMKYVETVRLPDVSNVTLDPQPQQKVGWMGRLFGAQAPSGQGTNNRIALYHTHSDESYEPTSGTASKESGDIFQVGKALKDALEERGFDVIWSQNHHTPHDGEAYHRSRRTVRELLRFQPQTMIDVHRDAVSPEVYNTSVAGQEVTKVRIVVGRQNQNRQANLEYALRMKSIADRELPGIIQGIFDARGNYNQDVGPRMILLEFGAHSNTLERAQQAARLFSRVIPAAAGMTPGSQPTAQRGLGMQSGRSALWIVGVALVGAIGYLLLNAGSLGGVGKRLSGYFQREIPGVTNQEENSDDDPKGDD